MQTHDRARLDARLEHRIPRAAVQRRIAESVRLLGKAHRGEAAGRVAADLGSRHLDIGEENDAQPDETAGMRLEPLLREPVVPGTHAGPAEFGVGAGGVHAPAEPGDLTGKADRRPDAGEIHVVDTSLRIPTPRTHLVEAHRLHRRPRGAVAPHHCVESDLWIGDAVEDPDLVTLRRRLDVRRAVGERRRHATLEEVPRLDHVIVDRDDGERDLVGHRLVEQRAAHPASSR